MEFIGYICSILIGVALGLIGGGGSILTVPLLVYIFKIDAILATGYSLFIVGITSAVGSLDYFIKGLVNLKIALIFGIPSVLGVFFSRAWIVPALPNELFSLYGFNFSKSLFLLLLFAILMIAAAFHMLKKSKQNDQNKSNQKSLNYPVIIFEGTVVGLLTGLIGAGGGFLIIPALVVLSGLPMKEAIGTSLLIIATKSLIGFFGETLSNEIEWSFLIKVTAISVSGIIIGAQLSRKIDGEKLKPAFAWFILAIGIFIIVKELLNNSAIK